MWPSGGGAAGKASAGIFAPAPDKSAAGGCGCASVGAAFGFGSEGSKAERGLISSTLVSRLHNKFRHFQIQAKRIKDKVEATQMPVDTSLVQELLERYSVGVADELRSARDRLRGGQWDIDSRVREDHDTLCIGLAVVELVHELCVSSAPSASRLLRWYNRHYLEEELAEWWQQASQWADDPKSLKLDSPFWEPLCRLALSDCKQEVLSLLQRASKANGDGYLMRVVDFLRRVPSLEQMERDGFTRAEFNQVKAEIQGIARKILEDSPADHPASRLLRIYAGCPQSDFEANEDVAAEFGRTWLEDLAYAHAWVLPDLTRSELGDLLRAVARRRTAETIDDTDRALFAALSLDVPGLLQLLEPDDKKGADGAEGRLPAIVVTHLVDVLYWAGRVPLVVEAEGHGAVPPRDFHLIRYAKELGRGPRQHRRLAMDYLRAGGQEAAAELQRAADDFCATAGSDAEMEEAIKLLDNLDLAAALAPAQCRRRALARRADGDLVGCLRWACQAEHFAEAARGFHISELLDSIAEREDELEALLAALAPSNPAAEPLARYPPESLLALLAPTSVSLSLPPSGRLYFFAQFARCRALRSAGRPASEYVPVLVRLLAAGVAGPPTVARKVLEDEILPTLAAAESPLGQEDALALMRYVEGIIHDPFGRVKLTKPAKELHLAMGSCISRAILRGPSVSLAAAGPPLGHGLGSPLAA